MNIEYDQNADALYFSFHRIGKGKVSKTIEVDKGIYLDYDSKKAPSGLEILGVTKKIASGHFKNIEEFILAAKALVPKRSK